MMTALIVARTNRPGERVLVSRKAAQTPGLGHRRCCRAGKKVPLEPLLQALIMISANDAAVALAEHDGGSVTRFVKEMNRQAKSMGLDCTHYSTPNGLRDRGNYSCPVDLAELARADLANPRIAQIAQTRYAQAALPDQGQAPLPLQQPLLPAARARRAAAGAGHRAEDGVHRSRGALLRDDRAHRRPPARGRVDPLAEPDHAGARPAAGRVRGGGRGGAGAAAAQVQAAPERLGGGGAGIAQHGRRWRAWRCAPSS